MLQRLNTDRQDKNILRMQGKLCLVPLVELDILFYSTYIIDDSWWRVDKSR